MVTFTSQFEEVQKYEALVLEAKARLGELETSNDRLQGEIKQAHEERAKAEEKLDALEAVRADLEAKRATLEACRVENEATLKRRSRVEKELASLRADLNARLPRLYAWLSEG